MARRSHAEALEVYRLDDGGWRLAATHEGDTVIEAPPFDAVTLDLARLWAR
ncbi:MAG TPA: hypothetical protein VMT47_01565 [Polyangia bacterium]|nr:hypothetical protein [Polyangia bacterium]